MSRAGHVSGHKNAEHRTVACAPQAAGTKMLWLLLKALWPNFMHISKVCNTAVLTAQACAHALLSGFISPFFVTS